MSAVEPSAAGPGRHRRRRLLGLGAALPFQASCAERSVFGRGEPVALAEGQGLSAVVLRRVAVQGCTDRFRPVFEYIRRGDGRKHLFVSGPSDEWSPDPGQPLLLRTTRLMRLPAGTYLFFRMRWSGYRTSNTVELPPLRFEVSPGRAVYVGGVGVQAAFSRGLLGCDGENGSHFFHADAGSDIPFIRSRHPDLAGMEIADGTSVRPRWAGPPSA